MTGVSTAAVTGFIEGLARCGVRAEQTGPVVTFTVEACAGPLAGQQIPTAVGVDELAMWPGIPPHWVHLPAGITFPHTNICPQSTLPGWVRHSRQAIGWGDATEPAQAWLSHVRSVLASANAAAA